MRAIAIFAALLIVGASCTEQAGFMDFMKKVVDVGKKVVPIVQKVAPVALPLIKQVAASKGVQFAEVEQAGFFDKVKDFGKKVMSHPIVTDKVLPFVQQQGTKLVNDQLAKKNIPMQFAEQSGFFDKIKDFGKKVISHPIVTDKVLPFVQQQGTKLVNDQLAKKNIPVQFAEQSGFFDKIKDFGKKVISHPIVTDKVLPFVQQQGTKLVNDQLAKKNIPMQFAEQSGFVDVLNKAIKIGKDVVPVLTPAMKELIEKSKNLNIKDKNAVLQHIFETGKSAFETGKTLAPIVKQHI